MRNFFRTQKVREQKERARKLKMNCSLLDDEEYEKDMARMIPLWTAKGQKEFTDNRMIWDWIKYNKRAHAI